ncbi:tetratricopeptide repeat protein [Polyangium spumosum]|nr:tetratricopeptide repeat protein [Polyangium spumosum]
MIRLALDIDADGRADALYRAIAWSDSFSLIFVRVSSAAVRDELLGRMREWSGQGDFPEVVEVALRAAEWPFERLRELGLAQDQRRVVVLMGLEQHAIGDNVSPALAGFNFARDLLPGLIPGPLVILGFGEVFTALSASAPDLTSWRTFEISVRAEEEPASEPPARMMAYEPPDPDAAAEVERLSGILQGVLERRTGHSELEAARLRLRLGQALVGAYRYAEAEEELSRAVEVFEAEGREGEQAKALFWLGHNAASRSEHDTARARYEEALPLFRKVGDVLGEADCIKGLGDLTLGSDHDAARARYEEARTLYRKVGGIPGEANCIQRLGDIALRRADHATARARYEDARTLYQKVGQARGEANCIRKLGDLARGRSDHATARARYEEALPLYRKVGYILGEANCFKSLGDIALDRSDHATALARYEEALPLFRTVGSVLGEAHCIRRHGDIALERSEYPTARAHYEAARALFRKGDDLLGEANCIKGLGDLALERSDHDTARARYEEALPLFRKVGDVLGEANCIQGLGDITLRRSDHDTARARYEEALPLYRKVGDVLGEANCIRNLGEIALAHGEKDTARAQFEQALRLYQRIAEPSSIGWTHKRLADLAPTDALRQHHLDAARAAWSSIGRNDLLAKLDDPAHPDEEATE